MGTKLKSRQWHLAGTLPHGGTLPRGGTLPCGTDNAMWHTKDLTHDKKKFKQKLKN